MNPTFPDADSGWQPLDLFHFMMSMAGQIGMGFQRSIGVLSCSGQLSD